MDSLETRAHGRGLMGRVGERMRFLWAAKMIFTIVGMTAFFVVYFILLNHPRSPVTLMPPISIDRMIGFGPWALPLYVSLWLYVPLAPSLLNDRTEIASYALAALLLSAVGFGVFILWPTAVPKPDVDWSAHPSVSYLKAVDASGNAFPSLHVAFAVFTAIWFGRLLRDAGAGGLVRALNWTWCVGIVYSTLALRQHVALDALAGAILGATVALLNLGILAALRGARSQAPALPRPGG